MNNINYILPNQSDESGWFHQLKSHIELEMKNYYRSAPKVKEDVDLNKYGDTLFMNAHLKGDTATMNELVHDCKLEYTPIIKKFLQQSDDKYGYLRFFESRQLQEQMHGDLPVNDIKIKRAKI